MGRPKGSGKGKKDKFSDLSEDFKDSVTSSSTDGIRKKISDVAILHITMKALFKEDPEVQQAKDALADVSMPYRDDLKAFKLQLEFLKKSLDEKGGGASVEKPTATVPSN